jgi:hypothetical protein
MSFGGKYECKEENKLEDMKEEKKEEDMKEKGKWTYGKGAKNKANKGARGVNFGISPVGGGGIPSGDTVRYLIFLPRIAENKDRIAIFKRKLHKFVAFVCSLYKFSKSSRRMEFS